MECQFCGGPTAMLIGGMPVCDQCYERAGSCCLEFGGDDLWRGRDDVAEGGESLPLEESDRSSQVAPEGASAETIVLPARESEPATHLVPVAD